MLSENRYPVVLVGWADAPRGKWILGNWWFCQESSGSTFQGREDRVRVQERVSIQLLRWEAKLIDTRLSGALVGHTKPVRVGVRTVTAGRQSRMRTSPAGPLGCSQERRDGQSPGRGGANSPAQLIGE